MRAKYFLFFFFFFFSFCCANMSSYNDECVVIKYCVRFVDCFCSKLLAQGILVWFLF